MSYSALPRWPLVLFGIIEPILLVWAYLSILSSPFNYYAAQAPNNPIVAPADFPGQALGLTLAIGNVYVLLACLAVICTWTSHPETIKRYLLAVAMADIGHVYATYRAVGSEFLLDLGAWNDMIWANVALVLFLFVNRLATAFGVFGSISPAVAREKRSS